MIVREGYKWCPDCRSEIELNPAFWPTRRVKRADGSYREGPAGYCRLCKNKREARRQRDRRHGIPPKRTTCDICSRLKAGVQHFAPDSLNRTLPPGVLEEEVVIDPECLERLQRCEWDAENAATLMEIFYAHNRDEEDRDKRWRANRRRPSHHGISDPPSFTHYVCEEEELAWASVVVFLERQEQLRMATSGWARAALGSIR